MESPYRFDQVARTEKYFTASLLTHLLMANNFRGINQFKAEDFRSFKKMILMR